MKKTLLAIFMIILIVGGLGSIGSIAGSTTEPSTNVKGIIDSDTTWTKADSPYILTGLVGVASGVTLTIEPGVTVDLGQYSLQVGGTLQAQGVSGEKIFFLSETAAYGNIAFINGSAGWDQQNKSGCIIENANLSSTSISMSNVSPKINNNTITGSINIDFDSSPLISNNLIVGDIGVHSSSPKIDHNSIVGGINIGGNEPIISNNIIKGGGISGIGINFEGRYNLSISNNIIYGCPKGMSGRGTATIDKNLIIDNDEGLEISSTRIEIGNNTIANNLVGIRLLDIRSGAMAITPNNIQNNTQNSVYLENSRVEVDASRCWWGTIETQVINLTIHDRKIEPKLGTVSFVPTLSAPVPTAPTTEYTPIMLSFSPSQEPTTTGTPDQTGNRTPSPPIGIVEIAIAAIILSVAINISLVIVVARLLRKKG